MIKKKLISNKTWMQIHLYVSLFFIPMALIYAITGSFHIFGVRQNAGAEIVEVKVESPIIKGEEQRIILETLKKNHLKIPQNTDVRFFRNSYSMGNLKYSVTLSKDKAGNPIVRSVERGWYGVLLMLHKAAGKWYFDILAVGFSVALIVLYLSGLFLTAFCKRNYLSASIVTILGFFVTALAVALSL
ncbi:MULTISPECIES: hypothetical protein [Helicobacter]|uniref:hypothetical protein n=1 Tax=Helicobacter TaxID=209 RepID=UPI001FE3B20E|nr:MULTISPECIES: hypothetical protein [Helicobacter]